MNDDVTYKFRFQVGSYYRISYDPDGTTETQCDVTGVFRRQTDDGALVFDIEGVIDALVIAPGEITTIVPVHSKRIQPKIKMGKPRGVYPPTDEVRDPRSGRIHFVSQEEAEILCRSFGYENLTRPPFTEGAIDE